MFAPHAPSEARLDEVEPALTAAQADLREAPMSSVSEARRFDLAQRLRADPTKSGSTEAASPPWR